MTSDSPHTRENLHKNLQAQHTTGTAPRQDAAIVTVYAQLEKMIPEMQKALPKHLNAERMARLTFTLFRTTKALQSCSIQSLLGSVMTLAQLGLEPGILGQAYILPYKGVATPVIGYTGYLMLAHRSGQVTSMVAREVCDGDEFAYEYGLEDTIHHIPNPTVERVWKNLQAVYFIATFKDGSHHLDVMHLPEIQARKKRSPAASKPDSPWNHPEDALAMARKTVIRKNWRYLPLSPEILRAEVIDEHPITHFDPDQAVPITDGLEDTRGGDDQEAMADGDPTSSP